MTKNFDKSSAFNSEHSVEKYAERLIQEANAHAAEGTNQCIFYLRAKTEILKKAQLLAIRKKVTVSTLIENLIQEQYDKLNLGGIK